jgi:hypothetical protein
MIAASRIAPARNVNAGSGSPMPSRRTLPSGILPSGRSEETSLSPSRLRSVSYAGSIGTGSPEQSFDSQVGPLFGSPLPMPTAGR